MVPTAAPPEYSNGLDLITKSPRALTAWCRCFLLPGIMLWPMDPMGNSQRPHISIRSLVGSILLILGILMWFGLMVLTFGFSEAVAQFMRVVISISESAG